MMDSITAHRRLLSRAGAEAEGVRPPREFPAPY
jgi:hypothetical protein